MRADAERMMGGLFDVVSPPTLASPSVPISVSDIGFQYLVRTALLALQVTMQRCAPLTYITERPCI